MATKLPKEKRKKFQLVFDDSWCDRKLHSYHEGAVVVGDFFEEATSQLLACQRYKIDSTADSCPDLKEPTTQQFYAEVKAMGLTGGKRFFISKEQLDTYDTFLTDYFPETLKGKEPDWDPCLLYAFWVYDLGKGNKVGDFKFVADLRKALSNAVVCCYIVDFDTLKGIVKNKTVESYQNYPDFYNLRRKELSTLGTDWKEFIGSHGIPLNGHVYYSTNVSNLQVYKQKSNDFFLYSLINGHGMSKAALHQFFVRS